MKITPMPFNILVKPLDISHTHGGLIVPEIVTQEVHQGKVLAIGKDVKELGEIKIGDVVIYGRHGPAKIPVGGETAYIVLDEDVFAVIYDE